MSVPEPERHKGRLEVHVKAQFLASYTAIILKNPKVFNPEVDRELINRMLRNMDRYYQSLWEDEEDAENH